MGIIVELEYIEPGGCIMRELKRELWPYRIKVNLHYTNDITPIELWLGEKFGTFKGRWNVVYQAKHTYFYFRNEQDAVIFSLKWA
jgi:hypothetical protein